MNTEEEIITEVGESAGEDVFTYDPPFLRIISTFPTGSGRPESLAVELNLRDDEPVGEYDPDRPGEREAARSWVLDLVVAAIRELLGAGGSAVVSGPGVRSMLGHAGSDRWSGGDRKDVG